MMSSSDIRVTWPRARRFGWGTALCLQVGPVAVSGAVVFALRPILHDLHVSPLLVFMYALPILQLAVMRHAAPGFGLQFLRRLPAKLYVILIPSLTAVVAGVHMLVPGTVSGRAAAAGIVAVVVGELYHRGFLLARLPVTNGKAVVVSAALSAVPFVLVQPAMFVVHLLLTAVVVRFGDVRVSMIVLGLISLTALPL